MRVDRTDLRRMATSGMACEGIRVSQIRTVFFKVVMIGTLLSMLISKGMFHFVYISKPYCFEF